MSNVIDKIRRIMRDDKTLSTIAGGLNHTSVPSKPPITKLDVYSFYNQVDIGLDYVIKTMGTNAIPRDVIVHRKSKYNPPGGVYYEPSTDTVGFNNVFLNSVLPRLVDLGCKVLSTSSDLQRSVGFEAFLVNTDFITATMVEECTHAKDIKTSAIPFDRSYGLLGREHPLETHAREEVRVWIKEMDIPLYDSRGKIVLRGQSLK